MFVMNFIIFGDEIGIEREQFLEVKKNHMIHLNSNFNLF